jgi:hypothetical protein
VTATAVAGRLAGYTVERPVTESITALLATAERGDRAAADAVFAALYEELHRMARRELARRGAGVTPSATTLLHDAYLNISQREGVAFPGEVGPFYVEGATTNDMLVVKILHVMPITGLAAANVSSGFGGLLSDSRLRVLYDPIPARRYLWELDTTRMVGRTTLPDSRMQSI